MATLWASRDAAAAAAWADTILNEQFRGTAYREVVGECLGEEDWLKWSAEDRAERIIEAIESREGIPDKISTLARKTLAVFQAPWESPPS